MSLIEKFKKVTTFIFDIDGVLTDGTVMIMRDGLQARQMHVKDGFGLQMAVKNGYNVMIVSGGYSEESKVRLEKLGVHDVQIGIPDKTEYITNRLKQQNIQWEHVLYMGDDLPDLPLMERVGVSTCPADAVSEVRSVATYVSPVAGGWGCVRDVIEKVLKIRNDWKYDHSVTSK